MNHSASSDRGAYARADELALDSSERATCEVAQLLMRAGVNHSSSLWFQLLELATQQACDWLERSAGSGAPLSPKAAAVLGLRSLAAEILSASPAQADPVRVAAEACLSVCAEMEAHAARLPPRRRRWGEGAVPQSPQRPGLLERTVGCC